MSEERTFGNDHYIARGEYDADLRRIDVDLQRLSDEDTRQNARIDKLEDMQDNMTSLTVSVKELALEVKNMVQEIAVHGTRLRDLEERDGDKWRKVIACIITGIVSAVLGFGLSHIGF